MLETFRNLARSVFGMNHVKDTENQYLEVVGNGLDAEHPRNARTLDIAGNEVLAGRLTVGAQPVDDNDVATKKYVDDNGGGSGGGGVFPIELSWDDTLGTTFMNKTVQEIKEAASSGKMLHVYEPSAPQMGMVTSVLEISNKWVVVVAIGDYSITVEGETASFMPTYNFEADSLTDYPSNAEF